MVALPERHPLAGAGLVVWQDLAGETRGGSVWIPTMSAACSEAKSATYSDLMSAGHSD